MRIAVASDHAGFRLKEELVPVIRSLGHEVIDVGTHGTESVDYPDYAVAGCQVVLRGDAERAILLCGSGVGMSVVANKLPGIRAANIEDVYSAHQGVEHDDMNVLVLGGRTVGAAVAADLVRAFLSASYTGEPRHARRLQKLLEVEAHPERFVPTPSPTAA
ncbi:MAG: ribose 5-phosphate isomerase B [Phycisphaerales bacterium]|jgi:ribose 5-phosphate isomerase B